MSSVIWVIFEIISGNLAVSSMWLMTDIDAQFLPHNFWAQILKEAKQLLRPAYICVQIHVTYSLFQPFGSNERNWIFRNLEFIGVLGKKISV